jgi:hypothetical protein
VRALVVIKPDAPLSRLAQAFARPFRFRRSGCSRGAAAARTAGRFGSRAIGLRFDFFIHITLFSVLTLQFQDRLESFSRGLLAFLITLGLPVKLTFLR